ncbi:hypothetical protein PIB30_039475 [Stylosanthes scabra]|uniref:Uncharacterized protein n=1 Tax=Stylosanthes scabra TaxID=79078 RepID=A0ABU6XCE2_9FABA|nr:hypothetical protein [Stylosanthes scabra]
MEGRLKFNDSKLDMKVDSDLFEVNSSYVEFGFLGVHMVGFHSFEFDTALGNFKTNVRQVVPRVGEGLLDFLMQQKLKDRDVSMCPRWPSPYGPTRPPGVLWMNEVNRHRDIELREREEYEACHQGRREAFVVDLMDLEMDLEVVQIKAEVEAIEPTPEGLARGPSALGRIAFPAKEKGKIPVPNSVKGKEKVEVEPLINLAPELPKEDEGNDDLDYEDDFLDEDMAGVISILPSEFAVVTLNGPTQSYLEGYYFEPGPTKNTMTFPEDEGSISFDKPIAFQKVHRKPLHIRPF